MATDREKMNAALEEKRLRVQELKEKRAARGGGDTTKKVDSKPAAAEPRGSPGVDLNSLDALVGPKTKLAVVTLSSVNIEPAARHSYDKEVQCDLLQPPKLTGKAAELEKELQEEKERLAAQESKLKTLTEQLKLDKIKYDQLREDDRLREPKTLSAAEQKAIEESKEFQSFFLGASKIVERAMTATKYDVTVDYALDHAEEKKSEKIVQRHVFRDEKRTSSRPVSAMSWSPKYPELLLAAYAGQDDPMSLDPDGLVLVWNMHLPARPEYTFTCNSAVLSAAYHPSNPKLIVGGCRSGQVVIWDTREKSTPINRTSLSRGHTYPVYSLQCVPLVNKIHNIVSVSTDGHLCVWADNNLHDPSSELHLQPPKEANKAEITTTCFDFPGRDNSNVLLGSDEGVVYKARLHEKEGLYEQMEAHAAPLTNVHCRPLHKNAPSNAQDYFLTSSFDWTVKLWSSKLARPLYTFESARDYVFDCQWSPVHPAVFAQGDGSGKVDVWNINVDTDVPAHSVQVDTRSASGEKGAVSRVRWSEDGGNLAVGTSTGSVHIYQVDPSLVEPTNEDSALFYDKLHKKTVATL